MPNESGRIDEHKATFCKQLIVQALKYTPLSVRDAFRISTRSLSGGFVCKRATLMLSAGGYRTVLHYCSPPFWIGGELPLLVVMPHAPNRDARIVTVRYEYMYRSTSY